MEAETGRRAGGSGEAAAVVVGDGGPGDEVCSVRWERSGERKIAGELQQGGRERRVAAVRFCDGSTEEGDGAAEQLEERAELAKELEKMRAVEDTGRK